MGGFGNDVEQQFDLLAANGHLMANGLTDIGVPQAKVGGVDTADNFTDEFAAHSNAQVQRSDGVPQAVDAVGTRISSCSEPITQPMAAMVMGSTFVR